MSSKNQSGFRPPTRQILQSPVHLLAFGGVAGLSPVGPGTLGTMVGVAVWWVLSWLPIIPYAVVVALLFVLGCWICGRSAKLIGVHDYGGIVFDEIVGFLITATPLLESLHWRSGVLWPWLLAAFLLFRGFDIVKPPPIRWLDRHVGGGFGIMLDDAVAAIPAALILIIALRIVG